MKILLLAIFILFVNAEAFAIERCPAAIRLLDLQKIANLKEGNNFDMKGDTWTLTYSSGDWQPILKQDIAIGDSFTDSRIIMKKGKEILYCEYQIFTVRENIFRHMDKKKGVIHIETVIND